MNYIYTNNRDGKQFIDDPASYEAYLLAVEYDTTLNIELLKKAVSIYNRITGAGISIAE